MQNVGFKFADYNDHKLAKIDKGKLLSTLPEIQKSGEESNQQLS